MRALSALCLLLLLMSCGAATTPVSPPPPGAVRVATYNVHYIILSKETGAWSVADWERRKEPLDLAFKDLRADIVGFQEMESFSHGSDGSVNLTLDWLRARNPDHAVAAAGDWRTFPSTQPILYRRDRFERLDQGWFFFSEMPDEIYSRTFDGGYPAYCTWAKFRERATGRTLTVFNVHFDYSSRENKRRSADLVAQRLAPVIASGERVLLIGDLNASLGSDPVATLKEAGVEFLDVDGSTYHWNRGLNLTAAIDHIGYSGALRSVGPASVVRNRYNAEWPTDHYPVFADFELE